MQTISTLKFATRAKIVKTRPIKMEVNRHDEEVERLHEEVLNLHRAVNEKQTHIEKLKVLVDEMKTSGHRLRVECDEVKEQVQAERAESSRLKEREKEQNRVLESYRTRTTATKATQTDPIASQVVIQPNLPPVKPSVLREESSNTKLNFLRAESIKLDCSIGESIKERRKSRQNKSFSIDISRTEDEDESNMVNKKHQMFITSYLKKLDELKETMELRGQDCLKRFIKFEERLQEEKYLIMGKLEMLTDYMDYRSCKSVSCTLNMKVVDEKSIEMPFNKYTKGRLLKQFNSLREQYVLMWGDSSNGKIGLNNNKPIVGVPTYLPGLVAKRVSLGAHMTAAIDSKGRLLTWGKGEYLGMSTADRYKPTILKDLSSKVSVEVCCGDSHTLCLTSEGIVYAWVSVS